MFKVLLFVPYPQLEQVVLNVYQDMFKNKGMEVDVLHMKAENIANTIDLSGYDAAIGRGYTTRILEKRNPGIPIVDIPITGYDILRGIQAVQRDSNSGRIGVFLPEAANHDSALLSAVSGLDIRIFVTPEIGDLSQVLEQAAREGYRTIIGGYSAKVAAEQAGLTSFTIKTGEEAVIQALKETLNVMDSVSKERERTKLYQTVIQASKEGMLYVNSRGIIEMVNGKGLQILESKLDTVHNQKLAESYPYLMPFFNHVLKEKEPVINELIKIEENKITLDFVPVIVDKSVAGIVITCQTVTKIQQIETQIRKKLSEKGLIAKYYFSDIIHKSRIMEETISIAHKYARVSSNILIVGETGTGKELMAQGIHNASERKNKPFVAVNCAALPDSLLESELFGYVEGAFTGSKRGGKTGLVEQAHQGTLFLDEIAELPISFQGKLLRVLQEKQVRRIGDDRVIDVDVRVIAATNRNLKSLVKEGKFRRDLLYRLDILKLYIPPIRERKEDIPLIFHHALKKYNKKFGKDISGCTPSAEKILWNYPFEGNIRELSNLAERLCVVAEGNVIDDTLMHKALYPDDVESTFHYSRGRYPAEQNEHEGAIEKERIIDALNRAKGRKNEAARLLEMDRSTLWRKMKKYGIDN